MFLSHVAWALAMVPVQIFESRVFGGQIKIYMSVCEPKGAEQRLCGEIWDAEKRNECPDTRDVENCWELGESTNQHGDL